ncbi:MAG: anthranilate phosphoribosyltransferase [Chthonomonadales bacterium]|nr:anthranilate phosphoribosyltransferase [Chthonomonadales bacterium]
MVRDALAKIVSHESLTEQEAYDLLAYIVSGEATPAQVGAILVGLRTKGETVDELTGFARALRDRARRVVTRRSILVDTCGTGGDASGTFNVSTAAAFVVAAAGFAVAKHGNRAVSGRCGSADVLEALGVRLDLTEDEVATCIDEVGIGFMFAPYHHPAVKAVSEPRREIGIRTVFNVLGPLANPAGATHQLVGVFDETLCDKVAEVLGRLGCERAMVVHGLDGVDEISVVGPTRISILQNGRVLSETRIPAEFFLVPSSLDRLAGGATPSESAEILRDVLSGARGPRRDMVSVNAAGAFLLTGIADSWKDGIALAHSMIDSRRAIALVDRLAAFTQEVAASRADAGAAAVAGATP